MHHAIVKSHSNPNWTPGGEKSIMDLLRMLGSKGEQIGQKVADYGSQANPLVKMMLGQDPDTQMGLKRGVINTARMIPEGMGREQAIRMAADPRVRQALQFVPGMAAATAGLSLLDPALGDESAGNKTMDAAAMMAGSYFGGRKGQLLGALAGVTGGKISSDVLQAIAGGM